VVDSLPGATTEELGGPIYVEIAVVPTLFEYVCDKPSKRLELLWHEHDGERNRSDSLGVMHPTFLLPARESARATGRTRSARGCVRKSWAQRRTER
jgi:hypothetical protein